MKGKVLIMVRTSTEAQSTEDQKKEMYEFCRSEGYSDIVCVERQGASAAKVDDDYREMIDEVKRRIEEDPDIKCYAVWHLNRAFRTEEVYIELKSFFVKHGVQVICKNPYLKLLTPDGKIDPGMELAMGLLAILAKQDNEERKAKFSRAKKSMAKRGQYIGGHTIPYGYSIDENGFFIEKPEESSVVKQVFELYSTGNYSTYSLSKELGELGINITDSKISRIIRCEAYTGKAVKGKFETHYPPIISKELFDAVLQVRNTNRIEMKRGERLVLGSKLVRCYKCGGTCTSNSRHYVCARHVHHGPCDNGFALRQCVADELLWRVASILHIDYLTNLSADKQREYNEQILVLQQKITAIDEKIENSEEKKKRIVSSYIEGLITLEDRDTRLLRVKNEVEAQLSLKASLCEKKSALQGLLEGIDKDLDYINSLVELGEIEYTLQEKYDIVHKHIISLVARQVSYGKRDPRTSRPNAVEITINTPYGEPWKYMYFPKGYEGHNLYERGLKKWIPDNVEITDKKVTR